MKDAESYYPEGKPRKRGQPIVPQIPQYVRDMKFTVVDSRFVAVMAMATNNRGMIDSEFHTRCVRQGEVHELICLRQDEAGQVDLNDVWYLGFVEFSQGCVLAKGMRVEINGTEVGSLVAFDMTHAPNHINILLAHPSPQTGAARGIQVNDECCFMAS